jgi:hypothetical protein
VSSRARTAGTPPGFDALADHLGFVTAPVVQDNAIPWLQGGRQDVLPVSLIHGRVDSALNDEGSGHARRPQARYTQRGQKPRF